MSGFDFGSFLRSLPSNSDGNAQVAANSGSAPVSSSDTAHTSGKQSGPPRAGGSLGLPPTASSQSLGAGRAIHSSNSQQLSVEQKLAARANSGAANALAAAAAGARRETAAEAFSGRSISGIDEVEYDVDAHLPGESQVQLEVTPITIVGSEPYFEFQPRIAVNDAYICYALKQGHIRALHQSTGRRALLKGASAPPGIRFASHITRTLASIDPKGILAFWDIELGADSPDLALKATLLEEIQLHETEGSDTPAGQLSFAWHPSVPSMYAVSTHRSVRFSKRPESASQASPSQEDQPDTVTVDSPGNVSSINFSPAGGKLAAVSSGNQVVVWEAQNGGQSLDDYKDLKMSTSFEPYGQEACSTAQWLSSTVLVTGNADNSLIKLWHVSDPATCLQTVHIKSSSGSVAFFNHIVVQHQVNLIILANAKHKAIYTLHFNGHDEDLRFDYLAEFSVSNPIFSIAAQYKPAVDPNLLQLHCVQAQAIQIYTLRPGLCSPAPTLEPSSTVPADAVAQSLAQLQDGATPKSAAADETQPAHQPNTVQSSASADGTLSAANIAVQQPPPSIRTTAPPAVSTEQPKLLTPTHLMRHVQRSASQSSMASVPTQHTPVSRNRPSQYISDAVSTTSTQGSKQQDGAVSRQQSAETIPSSAAAMEATSAPQYDSPTASVSGSRASTPPPTTPALPSAAYLTPEQYNTVSASPSRAALPSPGGPSDHATPSSDAVKLLTRDKDATASGPSQPPDTSAATSAAFSQPLDLLPVQDAAPQTSGPSILDEPASTATNADQQPQPPAAARQVQPAAASSNANLSDASIRRIADIVAERTHAQHKRMLAQLHEAHHQMLRIIKGEIATEGKRMQQALDAQINRLVETQGGIAADERRALMAEQQASMEKLVSIISASVHRDIPLRMEEIVKAEVSTISSNLQQEVASAVQAALAEALPQELAGPLLQTALEASLGRQLQQALARPLQDTFTAAFQHQLIPAFEGACRDMFAQVQATFAGGLAEHLQAAGGANAGVAASLRESLGTAAHLVDDLKADIHAGQKQLIQLASQRSGQRGGGPMSVADIEAQQDPTHRLLGLIKSQKYEEAFLDVLDREDVSMVAWLCSQVDPGSLLSQKPPVLSQQILLPMLQQLGHDLLKDTLTKLKWIQSIALALDPQDPMLAPHVKGILESLYGNLQRVSAEASNRDAASQAHMCLHLVNSLLHSCA